MKLQGVIASHIPESHGTPARITDAMYVILQMELGNEDVHAIQQFLSLRPEKPNHILLPHHPDHRKRGGEGYRLAAEREREKDFIEDPHVLPAPHHGGNWKAVSHRLSNAGKIW